MSLEMAIDPFGKRKVRVGESSVEKRVDLDETSSEAYEAYRDIALSLNMVSSHDIIKPYIEEKADEVGVLKPNQIMCLVSKIIDNVDKKHLARDYTGFFVSRLLQKSYEAGYNDFVLETGHSKVCRILDFHYTIKAEAHNGFRLTVLGDLGDYCCRELENAVVTVEGDTGSDFGNLSEDSEFYVYGDVDYLSGSVRNSVFELHGNSDRCFAHKAVDSVFRIYGKGVQIEDEYGPRRCTFKTPFPDVLQKWKDMGLDNEYMLNTLRLIE